MLSFWQLLQIIVEERKQIVPPAVLQAYDHEFQMALKRLIGRTQDPVLRKKFGDMIDCNVRDARGNCRSFSQYIVSALVKNRIQDRYDIEAALSYVFEKMMLPTTDTGEPRKTLFGDFDERQPYTVGFNPLQARFMKFLQFAVNNIRKGKIPRLTTVEPRPQGTVRIGVGRRQDDDAGGIAPDQLARTSGEADFSEIVGDITHLLRMKELAYGLPLVGVFQTIISGKKTVEQRAEFGDRVVKAAKPIIMRVIKDYAEKSGNFHLLSLLSRFEGLQPTPAPRQGRTPKPRLPEKERDFASILAVLDRLGRPAGTADLGRFRRRWLEYPPRNPASGFRNRLEEVLDAMVKERVLTAAKTNKGAFVYAPGPNAAQYQQGVAG